MFDFNLRSVEHYFLEQAFVIDKVWVLKFKDGTIVEVRSGQF